MEITGLSFDDVLLRPAKSVVTSRDEINLFHERTGLRIPLIAAPMTTVTNHETARIMYELGGQAVIPRFSSIEDQMNEWRRAQSDVFCAVGVMDVERLSSLLLAGRTKICIDVAHAHSDRVLRFIRDFIPPEVELMAGNVATAEGFLALADAGVKWVSVGIGDGSACITRIKTGFGVPQFTAIAEAERARRGNSSALIIADGGIRGSGDIVKAIAAGADAVMIGNLFAGAIEAPHPGLYYGEASERAAFERSKPSVYIEGVEGTVPVVDNLKDIVADLLPGIRSGISYGGGRSIEDIRGKVRYHVVSANTLQESRARI